MNNLLQLLMFLAIITMGLKVYFGYDVLRVGKCFFEGSDRSNRSNRSNRSSKSNKTERVKEYFTSPEDELTKYAEEIVNEGMKSSDVCVGAPSEHFINPEINSDTDLIEQTRDMKHASNKDTSYNPIYEGPDDSSVLPQKSDPISQSGVYESDSDSSTLKPDDWSYPNESEMNGGASGDVYAYDKMDGKYASLPC
jgi:hypothetical protein